MIATGENYDPGRCPGQSQATGHTQLHSGSATPAISQAPKSAATCSSHGRNRGLPQDAGILPGSSVRSVHAPQGSERHCQAVPQRSAVWASLQRPAITLHRLCKLACARSALTLQVSHSHVNVPKLLEQNSLTQSAPNCAPIWPCSQQVSIRAPKTQVFLPLQITDQQ